MKAIAKQNRSLRRRQVKRAVPTKQRRLVKPRRMSRYDQLIAVNGSAPAASVVQASEPKAAVLEKTSTVDDWSKLSRNMRVLAADPESADGAWFPAIVQQVNQSNVVLIWEGWTSLGKFTRDVTQIAMLHPQLKAAF